MQEIARIAPDTYVPTPRQKHSLNFYWHTMELQAMLLIRYVCHDLCHRHLASCSKCSVFTQNSGTHKHLYLRKCALGRTAGQSLYECVWTLHALLPPIMHLARPQAYKSLPCNAALAVH